MDIITLDDYRAMRRRSKYGNVTHEAHGFRFDSRAEAERYTELRLLADSGAISALVVHPIYELQAAFTDAAGRRWRRICYEGDFGYVEDGVTVVEDTKGKGVITQLFRIKEKLFRYKYPEIDLRIILV